MYVQQTRPVKPTKQVVSRDRLRHRQQTDRDFSQGILPDKVRERRQVEPAVSRDRPDSVSCLQ